MVSHIQFCENYHGILILIWFLVKKNQVPTIKTPYFLTYLAQTSLCACGLYMAPNKFWLPLSGQLADRNQGRILIFQCSGTLCPKVELKSILFDIHYTYCLVGTTVQRNKLNPI